MNSIITGTGSYIPDIIKSNEDFLTNSFYSEKNEPLVENNGVIIEKFKGITGIEERRYLKNELLTSEIGTLAANQAIESAGIDPETIDQIIFAHNFGDLDAGSTQSDMLPSLASKTKHLLRIKNPDCVAYDLVFGCPGWVQGLIHAHQFLKSGMAKKCLVIGAETLSRIIDPHDRDSMIYADGAGACILESVPGKSMGILSHSSQTFSLEESDLIFFGSSNKSHVDDNTRYLKMHGRKIYEFALNKVPTAMKTALDQSGVPIEAIKKILIHQANEKMDEAIIKRFYQLHNTRVPDHIMPMSIKKLGNSSVATIPTLLDLILNEKLDQHRIEKGDAVMFASVGAGMNINAILYQF